ncbi:MAG: putative rane protein [Bacillales bacterium]|nr:putative rane protein [Bacillales bacterium]
MIFRDLLSRLQQSFWIKKFLEFILFAVGLLFFTFFVNDMLPYFFKEPRYFMNPNYSDDNFFKDIITCCNLFLAFVSSVMHPGDLKIAIVGTGSIQVFPYLELTQKLYRNSLILISVATTSTILASLLLSFLYMISKRWIKRMIDVIAIFIESIPDLMWIYLFILTCIMIFRTTGNMPIRVITYSEEAWVGPIICMSVVPLFQSFRIITLLSKQELGQLYVEFAYSRGFSKSYIIIKHVLRNTLKSLLNHFTMIYTFILTSLFVVEKIFNSHGLMIFFFEQRKNNFLISAEGTEYLFLWLLELSIPFFVIRTILEFIVKKVIGGAEID